jgi:anti-sigma factor RsiW
MRDALPDLLHERLDATQRLIVVAHVEHCVDCREELALLRLVRGSLAAPAPRVDVAAIVRALPAAPSTRSITLPRRRPAWADWRIAAAAAVIIAGGSSVAVYNARPGIGVNASASVQRAQTSTHDSAMPNAAASTMIPVSAEAGSSAAIPVSASATVASLDEQAATSDIGGDNRLSDLDEQQLQALLGEIQSLRAVPPTEPEPVRMRIGGMENVSIGGGA